MKEKEQYTYTSTRDLTMESLMADIEHELGDPKFEGRTHGRNDAYRDGCRGPLCRYRERTRKREAREARTRANLPCGVKPMRRTRSEQRWDNAIEATLEEVRTLGVEVWLNSRAAVRAAMSVPKVASQAMLGPIHTESGGSCGDAVALRVLQPTTPGLPVQRIGGRTVRS